MRNLRSEVWELDSDWEDKTVKVSASGMTVLTAKEGGISVGYSADERLERFRLISTAPELLDLLSTAKKLLNSDKIKDYELSNFNDKFSLIENKLYGNNKIQKPNYCRATYEWTDEHIEKYHAKVESLKYKL